MAKRNSIQYIVVLNSMRDYEGTVLHFNNSLYGPFKTHSAACDYAIMRFGRGCEDDTYKWEVKMILLVK